MHPDPNWLDHDRDRPQPPAITPAVASTPEHAGKAPSDAVVLFDGKDLSAWASIDGSPTKWIVKDGYMECVKGSGYIRTVQNFGDCQLHIEWATPEKVKGEGQGRGNSGVYLQNRYELQVLDSYENKTYFHGQAGSIYKQHAPLVNVSREPGQWQSYDIVFHAPRFDPGGKLLKAATITVLQNGVLVQDHVEILGATGPKGAPKYEPHALKQPLALQDHGNPVKYRNIWIREL